MNKLSPFPTTSRFALQTNFGREFYVAEQIIRLESESNYTYVFFKDRKPLLVAKVLHEFEAMLKPMGFIRTHRSHLVNKSCIVGMDTEGSLCLTDASKAAISRRKRKEVIRAITPPFQAA